MIWDTLTNIPSQQLLTFMVGALVLNMAPGQDVLFASSCGIKGGPRAGAYAGIGVGLGVFCHLVLVTVGLGAIMATHPQALSAIKYAGAAYLLWLAWKSWNSRDATGQAQADAGRWNIIRRGMTSNLLNPKPLLFLLAFLPQFTHAAYGPIWLQVLGLGLMFTASSTVVTMGYGILAGYAGQVISRRMGFANRIAAVMFAFLAVRLVVK